MKYYVALIVVLCKLIACRGQQYRGQEIRGVFPVVQVPPAFSENLFDSPVPDSNGASSKCADGRCSVCINGQCFHGDGSPVTERPRVDRRPLAPGTAAHNCRDGRCRPCRGFDCPISDAPDWSGGSGQIRIGRVGGNGEPLPGGSGNPSASADQQRNRPEYRYGGGYGKKSKKSKKSGYPDPSMYPTFPCQGDRCSTCLGSKCYPRTYATIRIPVYGACPPAACDDNCTGFVNSNVDSCPICICKGFATREPCLSQTECPSHGSCQNYLCRYAPLSGDESSSGGVCRFAYQCRSNEFCQSDRCNADPSSRASHLELRTCAHDYHCPDGYFCRDSTCWTDDRPRSRQPPTPAPTNPEHRVPAEAHARPCAFHYQCPSTFLCDQTRCIRSGVQHSNAPCASDVQCKSAEYCIDRTCVPSRHVGFVKIPLAHLFRCEYVPCHNAAPTGNGRRRA